MRKKSDIDWSCSSLLTLSIGRFFSFLHENEKSINSSLSLSLSLLWRWAHLELEQMLLQTIRSIQLAKITIFNRIGEQTLERKTIEIEMNIILLSIVWYIFNHLREKIFERTSLPNALFTNEYNDNRKKIHLFTALHFSYIHYSRGSHSIPSSSSREMPLIDLSLDHFVLHFPTTLLLVLFLLLLLVVCESVRKISRQREKEQDKKPTEEKNETEPIQHQKEEGNTLHRQWNATHKRERERSSFP